MANNKGYWLNKESRLFLSRGYLKEGQTAEERIREIAEAAAKILNKHEGFADKLEDYMLRGWFSLSSPVWSNFGNDRGLPISCAGSYVEDTMESILFTASEVGMQTKLGAGTSMFLGDLRERGAPISVGGNSHGPVHFMEIFESIVNIVSQSNIRRGACAVYLPVEHPDIKEFLQCREEGNSIQHLSLGVTITDKWMQEMIDGDAEKRKIWMRIIQKRFETGYPYIFFTDTVNNNKPDVYKDKNMKINASNLCSEICLPSSAEESFICCLSSMNLLHYDEWKDTDAVEVMTALLDAVMEEYIQKTKDLPFMQPSYNFAKNHRAIGLGVLGWHSFLQSKMISFESEEAVRLNIEIHKLISEKALNASKELAKLYGEPELLKGYGRRNTTLMAIAPTSSSSFILGQISPSIEPLNSNYFIKDLAKGKFTYKNPYLKELLKKHNKDVPEVWDIILKNGGSVQNLFFLSDHEKNVFKTFGELSQWEIISQAADRQQFIDQSASLNLMIHPDTPLKDVNLLMIDAWKMGVKSLYYQRSANKAQELSRELVACKSCEA